jgi:hypothetical protein
MLLHPYSKKVAGITIVSYSPNKGKGFALRQGFKKAIGVRF